MTTEEKILKGIHNYLHINAWHTLPLDNPDVKANLLKVVRKHVNPNTYTKEEVQATLQSQLDAIEIGQDSYATKICLIATVKVIAEKLNIIL